MRDKLIAHAGSALLVIGTAVPSSTALAVLVTVPVTFTVLLRDRPRHRGHRGAAGVRPASASPGRSR